MTFSNIKAKSLTSLVNVLNKALAHFSQNIDESNLKLSYLEIKEGASEPTAKEGKSIIYTEIIGIEKFVRIKYSDGTIKTFTLT